MGHTGWAARVGRTPAQVTAALVRAAPALAGLALGALVLGPGLGPGFILSYDMVAVPDPPANAQMFGLTGGFPRPVPSDAVVAALSVLVPAQVVQKMILLGGFALAAAGAARLVPGEHLVPRLAAAVFYVWNPFVAERLVLGHWALLLGYAGLPWVVRALATSGPPRRAAARLTRALVPAAIGGFAAMNVSLLIMVGVLVARGLRRLPRRPTPRDARRAGEVSDRGRAGEVSDRGRASGGSDRGRARGGSDRDRADDAGAGRGNHGVPAPLALAVAVGMSLPWLLPALLRPAGAPPDLADPAGVALFAARADTPFGSVGSLLSLGGIWNGEVVPPGYASLPGATGRLLLGCLAIGAYLWLVLWPATGRRGGGSGRLDGTDEVERDTAGVVGRSIPLWGYAGLALAAVAGLAVACAGLTEPGRAVLRWLVSAWPGFAVLRDAHVYVAPLALLEAVGLGALTAALLGTGAGARAVTNGPGADDRSRGRSGGHADGHANGNADHHADGSAEGHAVGHVAGIADAQTGGPQEGRTPRPQEDQTARPRGGRAVGAEEGRAVGAEEGRAGGAEEGRAGGAEEGRAGGAEEGRAGGAEEGREGGAEEGRAGGAEEGRAGGPGEGRVGGRAERSGAGLALAALVVIAPVALLPALAWGVGGRLDAISYPADWSRARTIMAHDPVPGAVLSLPWAAHRRVPWAGGRRLLDPAPRMLARRVVWNDALIVGGGNGAGGNGAGGSGASGNGAGGNGASGTEAGGDGVGRNGGGSGSGQAGRGTAPEDPRARAAGRLLGGTGPLAPALGAAGYRYVVVERSAAGPADLEGIRSRLTGAERVLDGPGLLVYRIGRPAAFKEAGPPPAAPVIGALITLLLTLWSFGASGSSLVAPRSIPASRE